MLEIKRTLKEAAAKRAQMDSDQLTRSAGTYRAKAEKLEGKAKKLADQVSEINDTTFDVKIMQMLEKAKELGVEFTGSEVHNPGQYYARTYATGVFKGYKIEGTLYITGRGPALGVSFSWSENYWDRPAEFQGRILEITYFKNLLVKFHHLDKVMGDKK